ncbi:unnamed protein product [Vitrella brassicaformis CCMP3155]|uniref:phosphopyruvate hydratase n=1 Tax=Vitrella brassicaformis (strain CCMP3155) TaxID=1169540 RepID=A0A0G4EKN8_VITBC|nr:unnamed protein product [Vitrella brassicaformis CCMP3155]|eukprot:CEL96994.1 unnamed protein product [Vitrella brassicaformis CCMP3155]
MPMEMSAKILNIRAREVLDSRGNPTVEVDLMTEMGLFRSIVPSGASTGIYEANELRDADKSRYKGKGCLTAVRNVHETIKPALTGKDATEQRELDKLMTEELDGSKNEWGWTKGKLGANAILGVSMALSRAGAAAKGLPLYAYIRSLTGRTDLESPYVLPVPFMNVINGGSHAGNTLAFQEFMVLPSGASSFSESVRMASEIYQTLKGIIKKKYGLDATNVGDEGGFAPPTRDADESVGLLMDAIQEAGHAGKVNIAMDVAASEMYTDDGKYNMNFKSESASPSDIITAEELGDIYRSLTNKYPITSIEDPYEQDDWAAYSSIMEKLGDKIQIVGDDLLVTNPTRVAKAGDLKACNALLLKVNQIGTVTEALEASLAAQKLGWNVMVSHRSGETEDTYIADLATGLGSGQIKAGAPCRSERTAKYNQLTRIEEELGDRAKYAGEKYRSCFTQV